MLQAIGKNGCSQLETETVFKGAVKLCDISAKSYVLHPVTEIILTPICQAFGQSIQIYIFLSKNRNKVSYILQFFEADKSYLKTKIVSKRSDETIDNVMKEYRFLGCTTSRKDF